MILAFILIAPMLRGRVSDTTFMVAGALIQNSVVIVCIIVACIFLDRRKVRDIGLKINRRWWLDFWGGIFLGGALMGIIFTIQYLAGLITLGKSELNWQQILSYQSVWLLAMIFVGVGEEILSRGYQLKNLTEGFKRLGVFKSFLLASVITSSIFGVQHMFNPNATVIAVIGIILAGIMFCVARIFTGSLAAPIGMHISWNYFQGAVFGFPVSGNSMPGSLIKIDKTVDSVWTGGEFGPENSFMGLAAIIIAMTVFVMWPKKHSSVKENLVEMIRFRRRHPIENSDSNQTAVADSSLLSTEEEA